MIITGIFVLLLGTKLGQAATKTEVKYEGPNKVTMSEQRDESIVLPGIGSPPFAPSFFHQGSNFFFNPQFVLPGGIIPTGIERVITPFQPPNQELIIPQEPLINPQIEIEEIIQTKPQGQIEIDCIEVPVSPELPVFNIAELPNPIQVLIEDPSKTTGEPCDNVEFTNVPGAPTLMEDTFQLVDEIPPPPELPPLIITEFPKPVVVQENKRVILIPSAPELKSFYPPSIMVPENPLIPTDCAQNIIFERFLPNIGFENGKMVELISIPATKRAPMISSVIY